MNPTNTAVKQMSIVIGISSETRIFAIPERIFNSPELHIRNGITKNNNR